MFDMISLAFQGSFETRTTCYGAVFVLEGGQKEYEK